MSEVAAELRTDTIADTEQQRRLGLGDVAADAVGAGRPLQCAMRIAVLGVGTVGRAVFELLAETDYAVVAVADSDSAAVDEADAAAAPRPPVRCSQISSEYGERRGDGRRHVSTVVGVAMSRRKPTSL